jgi:hypothetical protein
MAMSSTEFIAMAKARNSARSTGVSTGTSEIVAVYEMLAKTKRTAIRAVSERILHTASGLAHGYPCLVTALSPSDKQTELFLSDLALLSPEVTGSQARYNSRSPNNLAVAVWVSLGPIDLLFGADLEETADPETGWSVIVNSASRPQGQASLFKVPHHGSANGHSDDVWDKMLTEKPFAILTPYERGGLVLPRPTDVKRIVQRSGTAFSTSHGHKPKIATKHDPVAYKMLRQAGITVTSAQAPMGHIRFRNGGAQAFSNWTNQLGGAAHILV